MPVAALAVVAAFIWSYWFTLFDLAEAWSKQPDYSHGFIVPPLAALLLWLRRDRFPGLSGSPGWPGLILIALAGGMRMFSAWGYLETIDGWSIPVWAAGAVWLLGGRRVLLWCLPAIVFLAFMVPLPFRAETALSYPLQRIATKVSCFALQFFGQAAIAEGNTILLGTQRLEVERACSGLRIFMGTVALAYVYAVQAQRGWWEKALMLAAAIPVALSVNALRIVVTGVVCEQVSAKAGQLFTHDLAGWLMIPIAALMFGVVMLYLRLLIREVEQADVGYQLRSRPTALSTG
jgi:exosortase